MIILAMDALDINLVEKFNCESLKQDEYGQTDLSEFDQLRTVVLWASFLMGKNMEKEIPVEGQWKFTASFDETFLKFFETYEMIDVPSFSFKQEDHAEIRKLLKSYFENQAPVEEYDTVVWRNHEESKKDFFDALGKFDLVMGYFDLADAVGHLSFGVDKKMHRVYHELDELVKETKKSNDVILIISDHGMKAVGRYGDHRRNGFYSLNQRIGLDKPRITSFYFNIERIAKNECS
ncbi:hypothetical protein GTO27_04600 [Candidatus Bathyarchaeota archaeon]|nr:hypothetical protein [Candidatus Bathyarchaeota archaeon]